MKLIILFWLVAPFLTLSAQTLNFDIMTTYSIKRNGTSYESSACAMSTNENFILKIVNVNDQDQIAQVYDLQELKVYEYMINDDNSASAKNKHKFTYLTSRPFKRSPIGKVYVHFENTSTEADVETVNLNFYKNKFKNKKSDVLELKILKSEINLFHLFRFTCLHPLEFMTEINYNNAGLVTNCISADGLANYKLEAFEEINLEITLPN